MFNNFDLYDEEILKIINDYRPLLISKAYINEKYDEDLYQELVISVFEELSKRRQKDKKDKNFKILLHLSNFSYPYWQKSKKGVSIWKREKKN